MAVQLRAQVVALVATMSLHMRSLQDVGTGLTNLFRMASEDVRKGRTRWSEVQWWWPEHGQEHLAQPTLAEEISLPNLEALHLGIQQVADARAAQIQEWNTGRCKDLENWLRYLPNLLNRLDDVSPGHVEDFVREAEKWRKLVGLVIGRVEPLGHPLPS